MQRPPEEAGPLRAQEQQAACAAVGVKRLTILDFPDGTLEYSLALREAIAREIRRFRPDVVRDADNRWVFPQLLREGLEPWGAKWLLVVGTSHPTHHVAVTEDGRDR